MPRTRIKFDGLMRPEDARAAADAGADAIGIVFYSRAPRCVSIDRAREILRALPPFITPVALFVDQEPAEILEITRELNLRHVQLHGHEPPEILMQLQGLRVIKAIRVTDDFERELRAWGHAIDSLQLSNLAGLLLDSASVDAAGGAGVANDFSAIARHRDAGLFDDLPPLIVAGGLTPETVGEVVRQIRPFAVDVSSGIESERGKKSVEKMQAFVAAVRECEQRGA